MKQPQESQSIRAIGLPLSGIARSETPRPPRLHRGIGTRNRLRNLLVVPIRRTLNQVWGGMMQ